MNRRVHFLATCDCGHAAKLYPDELWAAVSLTDGSRYVYVCPGCGEPQVREATDWMVKRMASVGVEVICTPPPQPHPERAQGGPAICHDDVLEFALSVAVVNDLAAYAAEVEA